MVAETAAKYEAETRGRGLAQGRSIGESQTDSGKIFMFLDQCVHVFVQL